MTKQRKVFSTILGGLHVVVAFFSILMAWTRRPEHPVEARFWMFAGVLMIMGFVVGLLVRAFEAKAIVKT